MFNPYHARPIGSEKFEKHLLTLMVEGFETQKAAKEALPEIPICPLSAHQERAEFDPIMEGYKALAYAVLAQAISDYLDEYAARIRLEDEDRYSAAYVHECRCLTLENEYFRVDGESSALLDGILREVIHNPKDHGKLRYRLWRIEDTKRKLSKIIHNV